MRSRRRIRRFLPLSNLPWLASKIDSLRISVARRILNFVEQLPPFSHGLIHQLQTVHEYDRKSSDECYRDTRPPENVLLSYDGCCLLELFPIEEFDRFEAGIRRLFPRSEIRDYFADFTESADQTVAGGWSRVGTLVPRGTPSFPVAMPTEAIDLPEYVESVEIWAHRPLPSLFVLSYHARLTKEVTDRLLRIQSTHYMPEVRFWPMLPTNVFYRSSSNLPEAVEHRTLVSYLKRIRSDLEARLAPFFVRPFHAKTRQWPPVAGYRDVYVERHEARRRCVGGSETLHARMVDVFCRGVLRVEHVPTRTPHF